MAYPFLSDVKEHLERKVGLRKVSINVHVGKPLAYTNLSRTEGRFNSLSLRSHV